MGEILLLREDNLNRGEWKWEEWRKSIMGEMTWLDPYAYPRDS